MSAKPTILFAVATLLCGCAKARPEAPSGALAVPMTSPRFAIPGHFYGTDRDVRFAATLGENPLGAVRRYYLDRGLQGYPTIHIAAARPAGDVVLLWIAVAKAYPRHLVYDPVAERVTGEFSGTMEGDEVTSPLGPLPRRP